MCGHVAALLQILAHHQEDRGALTGRAGQLLCAAQAYVTGREYAGHRGLERRVCLDETPLVQVQDATQEACVRRKTDEDEGARGLDLLGLDRKSVV